MWSVWKVHVRCRKCESRKARRRRSNIGLWWIVWMHFQAQGSHLALAQPVAGWQTLIDELQLFLLPTDSSKVNVKSRYRGWSLYLLQFTLAWRRYCAIFTIVLLNLNKLDEIRKVGWENNKVPTLFVWDWSCLSSLGACSRQTWGWGPWVRGKAGRVEDAS